MIILPSWPAPQSAQPFLIDYSVQHVPPLGGPVLQVNRAGSRFGMKVTMPPMRGSEGREWLSKLLRGKQEGVRMEFPILDLDPGVPGFPNCNATGANATTLPVRGFLRNYVVRDGQFFSFVTRSRSFLHMSSKEVIAQNDGSAVISVFPPMRLIPFDGEAIEFVTPKIEGFVVGNELLWEMALSHDIGLSFEIRESY